MKGILRQKGKSSRAVCVSRNRGGGCRRGGEGSCPGEGHRRRVDGSVLCEARYVGGRTRRHKFLGTKVCKQSSEFGAVYLSGPNSSPNPSPLTPALQGAGVSAIHAERGSA